MRQLMEPENASEIGYDRVAPTRWVDRRGWKWLVDEDRTILELTQAGATRRMIASALGMNAGNVTRRVQAIRTRLNSLAARQLLEPTCPLPDQIRDVAADHLIGGKTVRAISRARRIPLYVVNRHIDYARGVLRALTRRAQAVA
jgi:hypothetical protein